MTEAGFEKISRSDDALYGPRKLLLCGFPAGAQSTFATLLEMVGIQQHWPCLGNGGSILQNPGCANG
jgi:hypothetical protein